MKVVFVGITCQFMMCVCVGSKRCVDNLKFKKKIAEKEKINFEKKK